MIQIQLNFIKTIRLYYVYHISLVAIYIFLKLKQHVIYINTANISLSRPYKNIFPVRYPNIPAQSPNYQEQKKMNLRLKNIGEMLKNVVYSLSDFL